jgi:hypothetical protein
MGRKQALFAFLVLMGLVAFALPTDVQAGIKPCCVGGSNPGKFCSVDTDCPDACVGGAHDGKPCESAGCPAACIGGARDGQVCTTGNDCTGFCGTTSATCLVDSDCPPGNTCVGAGNCGPPGVCGNDGSCTGQCQSKGKGPKRSPSDPVAAGDADDDGTIDEELLEPVCSE